jgi:aminoglycoside phosphotransferase family enzyme
VSVYYEFGENPNDMELLKLYNFYQYCRAYIRGKVEGFKLDDPYIPEEEKAKVLAVAQSYFELAELYILEDN